MPFSIVCRTAIADCFPLTSFSPCPPTCCIHHDHVCTQNIKSESPISKTTNRLTSCYRSLGGEILENELEHEHESSTDRLDANWLPNHDFERTSLTLPMLPFSSFDTGLMCMCLTSSTCSFVSSLRLLFLNHMLGDGMFTFVGGIKKSNL